MERVIGIDVGGTFTDFLLLEDGRPEVFKVLSTPEDPSIGFMEGLARIAESRGMTLEEFVPTIDRIVHGTTVTTNVVLTRTGAKTGLITTQGVRDALEMRRGIRERQYDNRYTNVPPLVPRYLRRPVRGRIDAQGEEIEPLELEDVRDACRLFEKEGVEAVALCFMNAFANPEHERRAKAVVEETLPGRYLSVSTEVLPSIRFYDRVSTTVLNAYVGPVLDHYLMNLVRRLAEKGFRGVLLIMQSNGGVVTPGTAKEKAAMTLLSGPAAGPNAGVLYAGAVGVKNLITVDMGGTSFDAALVKDGRPSTVNDGEIARYRIALPMMGIVTIGAGGGSIGWIDEGGLLRMGPQSAGADPGPACYGRGGTEPTCTDADLILGYLDAEGFAGGTIRLDRDAAVKAVEERIARPLGMSVEEAAVGMYRVINTNMAYGVRQVTIERGEDPREFPMVVAGGAGPIHACMIASELEIPFFIVPRESSIFCAAGMLMTDIQHDTVHSFVARWDRIDPEELLDRIRGMIDEGKRMLAADGIPEDRWVFSVALDMRYLKQYHEVTVPVPAEALGWNEIEPLEAGSDGFRFASAGGGDGGEGGTSPKTFQGERILEGFHAEHERLYGYELREEGTPVELINIRVKAVGRTDRPRFDRPPLEKGASAEPVAVRRAYVPERESFEEVPVYRALELAPGVHLRGPALLDQPNTTIFVSAGYGMVVDGMGSYLVFAENRVHRLPEAVRELLGHEARR
jgi:N-methylhydantoinase A